MMIYTALGDSITAGRDASVPWNAYPQRIARTLRMRGVQVQPRVFAKSGWSSRELTSALLGAGLLAAADSDVVTIWVGGNDLIEAARRVLQGAPMSGIETSLLHYGQNVRQIVEGVRGVSRARIVVCTQFNPFPNSPVAAEAVARLNEATYAAAGELRVQAAPVHRWFAGRESRLIDGYGNGRVEVAVRRPLVPVHPNDEGHRAIADGLLAYMQTK